MSTASDISPRELRAMLQENMVGLLAKLFPRYAITFPVFTPLNPTRNDKTPGSFVIWTAGAAKGGFNEYSPAGPPASGDIVDLIGYVHNRAGDRRFCFDYARDFLGIKKMDPAALRQAKQKAQVAQANENAAQTEQAKAKIARAHQLWAKSLPLAGSVGETYLASRRIALAALKNFNAADLRFIPRLEYWKGAKWEGDMKVADGERLPVMIAALRNLKGDLTAVHCTFLRADGSGKADVAEPKLMRGVAKGSAIWLTHGDSGAPPWEAQGEIGTFIPMEGIENALSVALGIPEARVAACGSFDLMMALDTRPAVFDPVIYGLDNDDNPNADDTIADRIDWLKAEGKDARTMRPPAGFKDFNDVLRGKTR